MTNKIHNNLSYFLTLGLLTALTILLNNTTKIYECAAVFTFIALFVNALTSSIGPKKAIISLALSALASFAILRGIPYYIEGKNISGIVAASYCSLVVSLYWSATVFAKLKDKVSIVYSAFASLILAAMVDGFIMSTFYIVTNKFSYARILDILTREVSYKALYAALACTIIASVIKSVKARQIASYE